MYQLAIDAGLGLSHAAGDLNHMASGIALVKRKQYFDV